MSEIPDFVPEEWQITLVSGLGNESALVKEPHEQAAIAWREQGLQVVTIHPDYEAGLGEAMEAIGAARTKAEQQGLKLLSVGSGEGGALTVYERVHVALSRGEVNEPLSDKGVTICSRHDLMDYPPSNGHKYPTAHDINERSPLVAEAAEGLSTGIVLVKFTPVNTLAFTAGLFDEQVPPESSVPQGARAVLLKPTEGKVLTHDTAIKTVLLTPRHRDRVLSVAGYKPPRAGGARTGKRP